MDEILINIIGYIMSPHLSLGQPVTKSLISKDRLSPLKLLRPLVSCP